MAMLRHIVLAAALCASLGVVQARRPARVAEGKRTSIEKAPWMVQIAFMNSFGYMDSTATCAGSIIDSKTVLTAAHCFDEGSDPIKDNKVLVGATGKNGVEAGQMLKIASASKHPKFNGGNGKYDLAVLKLAEPIEFNDKVKAIKVAERPVPDDTKVNGGGWGTTKSDPTAFPEFDKQLRTAELTKMSREWCNDFLSGIAMTDEERKSMLCLQAETGVPCAGDSGSPAWVPAKNGKPAQQFGVLQGGTTCVLEDAVPLYVDLLHKDVRDFLVEHGVVKKKAKAHLMTF